MLSDQSELGKISPPSNPSEVASLEQKLIKKEQNILMLQAEVNKVNSAEFLPGFLVCSMVLAIWASGCLFGHPNP